MTMCSFTIIILYRMEGKFGGCKLTLQQKQSKVWQISAITIVNMLFSIEQSILVEETLTNLW